jgi:hypothetical protein
MGMWCFTVVKEDESDTEKVILEAKNVDEAYDKVREKYEPINILHGELVRKL